MNRASFDDDPDAYDRTRPVAPGYVFDELVRLAGLAPGTSVVEIGPGTGQATRPIAQRGIRVVAVELGPGLAALAKKNLADLPGVTVVADSFEAWSPGDAAFDAVVACNSFHWVDPATRFEKSASVLGPGGHLVVLATPWVIPADADRFWWDVQDDYVAAGMGRVDPATKHPDLVADLGPSIVASDLFEKPTIRRHRFDATFTAESYAAILSTQSGVKAFPAAARAKLTGRVGRRVEAQGGAVTAHLLAVLVVARRR